MDRTRSGRSRAGLLRGKSRGQSLVEFSLVLPVLMILVFGIIDFGMGLRSYIGVTNAAREGARYAALGSATGTYPASCAAMTNTTVIGRVCKSLGGLPLSNVSSVTVTYPNGQVAGNQVVVALSYTYQFITPIGAVADFFSGGAFPSSLAMQTSTTMRLE